MSCCKVWSWVWVGGWVYLAHKGGLRADVDVPAEGRGGAEEAEFFLGGEEAEEGEVVDQDRTGSLFCLFVCLGGWVGGWVG